MRKYIYSGHKYCYNEKQNKTFEFGMSLDDCSLSFLISAPIPYTIFCDIKMKWGYTENRIAVISLHNVDMKPDAIFKTLKII